jgi:uncharacterized protein
MSLTVYQSSVPVFGRSLSAFLGVLDKAEAHAQARKFDPVNYLAVRLSPDMFPLSRQIQSFCDQAKNGSFRLAAAAPPVMDDNEASIAEFRARIKATIELLKTIDPKAMDGAEDREIAFPVGANKIKMRGAEYLLHFVLPNFYFHLTSAYNILRAGGVEIGKRDFMGVAPTLVRV